MKSLEKLSAKGISDDTSREEIKTPGSGVRFNLEDNLPSDDVDSDYVLAGASSNEVFNS